MIWSIVILCVFVAVMLAIVVRLMYLVSCLESDMQQACRSDADLARRCVDLQGQVDECITAEDVMLSVKKMREQGIDSAEITLTHPRFKEN